MNNVLDYGLGEAERRERNEEKSIDLCQKSMLASIPDFLWILRPI